MPSSSLTTLRCFSLLSFVTLVVDSQFHPILSRRQLGVADGFEIEHAKLRVAPKIWSDTTLPINFNVSAQWPECASVVEHIADQGTCGSCWAVSSAGVFSDRICVASGGKVREQFSADDLMSCCADCLGADNGCEGGYPPQAFQWFVDVGVVTGGSHKSDFGCMPYPTPPVPACTHKCVTDYHADDYKEDKHRSQTAFAIDSGEVEQMQRHLMANGSLDVTYQVFDDFYANYTSGVYVKSAHAKSVGWHAVRIVGFGNDPDSGLDYWLVANSWGTAWGMRGFFKIVRGRNECSIEMWPCAANF